MKENECLIYLYKAVTGRDSDIEKSKSRKFSAETKVYLRIKEELEATPKCSICKGHVHPLSKDFDHFKDRKFGGGSEIENARPAHFYCNNSKDKLIALGIYKP